MHHETIGEAGTPCSCRSTGDAAAAAMASLLDPVSILPAWAHLNAPDCWTSASRATAASPLHLLSVPDSPPPRV